MSSSFANINPTYGRTGASHAAFLPERPCPNLKKLIEKKRTDVNIRNKTIDSERVRNIVATGDLPEGGVGGVFKVGPMLRSL